MRPIIRPVAAVLTIACVNLLTVPVGMSGAFAQAKAPAGAPPAPAPDAAEQEPPVKQIALTEKQVTDALAANAETAPIMEKIPEDAKPDPKIIAQLDAIAKKHGFANYADYDDVTANINLVLSGFDPETKKFIGQEAVLKKDIAAVQADKKMPAADKKETLAELNEALAAVQPLQFPGNAAIVGKYYDKLSESMPQNKE